MSVDTSTDGSENNVNVGEMSDLARIVEACLFLSPSPLTPAELATATDSDEEQVAQALKTLTVALCDHGLELLERAGGFTLATIPQAEEAARKLFASPRPPVLTAAQAETLSIVAYLQPVSRPEIARIRGVASESATLALVERGLIEEFGRSEFGAVLYRTTELFLKVFGLRSLEELPDTNQWDPSPEERESLRERLLKAGDARAA